MASIEETGASEVTNGGERYDRRARGKVRSRAEREEANKRARRTKAQERAQNELEMLPRVKKGASALVHR